MKITRWWKVAAALPTLTLAVTLAAGGPAPSMPAAAAATTSNLLANPSFEQAGATGPYYDSRVSGTQPAAASWTTYLQPVVVNPVLTEDLLPTTLGGAGTRMLHVTANGYGGIVQAFLPPGTGPAQANFSVWVFVVKGRVGAGVGNAGSTSLTSFTAAENDPPGTGEGRWIQLTGTQNSSPVSEFVVYGTNSGYNDFYVDLASVTAG